MKNFLIIAIAGLALLATSCIKDLGNYDYTATEEPVVTNLDSIYYVNVGDHLVVEPTVSFGKKENLSYEWNIDIPEELRSEFYEGENLDIFFGLKTNSYNARFAVVDNSNGMKYFYPFVIKSQANFSEGITLLTSNDGKAELSFVKPDGSIQSNIYEQIYGEPLPNGPRQLIALQHMQMGNLPYIGYWIICSDKNNPGVEIDVNTFQRIKYFRENFFDTQGSELDAQAFVPLQQAVMSGIINNKLYLGASSTYYISPIYGFFGTPVPGDYELDSHFLFSGGYYLGYDKAHKQLAYFDGGGNYYGDDYNVTGDEFDPKNLNIDILDMEMISMDVHYIIGVDKTDGQVYEFKFGLNVDPRTVLPLSKKAFIRQDLVDENNKWVLSNTEIFYFAHGSTVYRYNPLNDDIRPLSTDFGGKNVTMLKMGEDGETLIAGTEGQIYFMDVSTGKYGDLLETISGIEGEPVDLYIKEK